MRLDNPDYQTRRTAEYTAKDLLVRYGYEVIRVAQSRTHESTGINLIAWDRDGKILFISVRSRRKSSFRNDIYDLSERTRVCRYPGNVEYWIRHKAGWRRYLINAGGAIPLPVL